MVEAVEHHEVVAQRVLADVETAADALRQGVGESERDPEKLPGRELLVDAFTRAAGVPWVLEAVAADYRRRAHARTGWPFSRWVARFKPDPLRRLRIGTGGSGSTTSPDAPDPALAALGRSSLPAPTQAQRAQVELATRQVATRCGEDLPRRWADAVSDAATPPGPDLADALDRAVTSVDLSHRTPFWWRLAGLVQVLLALAAVVGLVWLAALAVVGWLRLPEIETPMVGPVPLPTLLLVGGLVLGLVLAAVLVPVARVGGRRRSRRIGREMRAAVTRVAATEVLEPVGRVLADHRAVRLALGRDG